jgi:hypothetical protein
VHLQSYNGPSLEAKLEAVKIDKSTVDSAMASVLPPTPVPTLPTPEPTSDVAAANSMAWVAGPVLGGVAFIAICGAAYWWLARRSAQATQRRYHANTAEATSSAHTVPAGNPTEAASSARAQASLQE